MLKRVSQILFVLFVSLSLLIPKLSKELDTFALSDHSHTNFHHEREFNSHDEDAEDLTHSHEHSHGPGKPVHSHDHQHESQYSASFEFKIFTDPSLPKLIPMALQETISLGEQKKSSQTNLTGIFRPPIHLLT